MPFRPVFLKVNFNIFLTFTYRLSSGLFASGFPTKTLYPLLLSSLVYGICPVHRTLLVFIT